MIGSLLERARATTIERVVATAGGNPLFIEELVASLADDPLSEELPGTVRAAISARIDALPPAGRTALLHASVIGQTFWRGVLADIGDLEDVDEALEMLEARGLVQRRSQSQVEDDVEFAFKHVLIRDTAYGTLPRAARRQLHAATAAHLERTLPDPAEVGWILAYHWREAGEPAKAIAYLLGSARRTADALAIEDTWDLYTRALDLAATDEERRVDPSEARARDGRPRGLLPCEAGARRAGAGAHRTRPDRGPDRAGPQHHLDRGQRRHDRDRHPSRRARGGGRRPTSCCRPRSRC